MTRDELYHLAAKCSRETALNNRDLINERVLKTFGADKESSEVSLNDVVARSTALAISLAPDLAAATTMRILIELGLVTPDPEDAE